MKKFIVIYHAPDDVWAQTEETTPEDRKKSMDEWMAWAKKCGSGLVEMGAPLVGGQKLSPHGKSGPSVRGVRGYSVLQAESMDEAKKLLEGHPHLGWTDTCEIEVHETMPM